MTISFSPRGVALFVSFGLVAGACGAGSSSGSGPLTVVSEDAAGGEPAAEPAAQDDPPPAEDPPATDAPDAATDAEPAPEPSPDAPAGDPAGENELPDVNVIDIATGDEVLLSSYAPAATPIVLWFWAPH